MLRRIVTLLSITLAAVLTPTLMASAAQAPSCLKIDPQTGLCLVYSSGGGSPGHGGGAGGASVGGGTSTCHWTAGSHHASGVVPCTGPNGAAWNGFCYVSLMTPQPPQGVDGGAVWEGHTSGAIYECSAPGPGESGVGVVGLEFWFANPPAGLGPSPAQLAQEALTRLTIPAPTPGRYPSGTLKDGRPYTLVNAYTWYWTAGAFRVLSATASAGGESSTITVTPSVLTFTPGDGTKTVSCSGPGVSWKQSDGPWAASPSGCDYRYLSSSISDPNGEVTATYGIDWSISWRSSDGGRGTLPDLTTTAKSTFAVAEAEAVVTK